MKQKNWKIIVLIFAVCIIPFNVMLFFNFSILNFLFGRLYLTHRSVLFITVPVILLLTLMFRIRKFLDTVDVQNYPEICGPSFFYKNFCEKNILKFSIFVCFLELPVCLYSQSRGGLSPLFFFLFPAIMIFSVNGFLRVLQLFPLAIIIFFYVIIQNNMWNSGTVSTMVSSLVIGLTCVIRFFLSIDPAEEAVGGLTINPIGIGGGLIAVGLFFYSLIVFIHAMLIN